jgi:guanylate kinase
LSDAPASLPQITRRGILLVLSSPSGAGKTTLSQRLLEADPQMELSISVTTRKPRPGEIHGQDYVFVDEGEFARIRDRGDLLEWARVFDHFYGTPRAPVERALEQGRDVLFDIDWQGTQQLAQKLPQDLVRVFILPPSATALEQRLRQRAQDTDATVARRMAEASREIGHWAEYDYVLVNADLDVSITTLRAIVAAERQRRERLLGLVEFVAELQKGL